MTKVAVFDPDPHVCGPSSWVGHVREGFRRGGNKADVVTFTKSGKPRKLWGEDGMRLGNRWWHTVPDATVKQAEAAEFLRGYDLVLLAEPRCTTEDKVAAKGDGLPYYIEVLRDAGVRWTTALQGPMYNEKMAPYLPQLFAEAGNCWTGVILAHSATFVPEGDRLPPHKLHVGPLPYQRRGPDEVPPLRQIIGSTGRVVPNKGQHLLAWVGDKVAPWGIELHGASPVGLGPNFTFELYEQLCTVRGWKGPRITPLGRIHGDVINPYAWYVQTEHGNGVSYFGGYNDALEVCSRFGIHVNLTGARFSHSLEYTTLEAIDAGCVIVAPGHIMTEPFKFAGLPGFTDPPGSIKSLQKPEGEEMQAIVATSINKAIAATGDFRDRVIGGNWLMLAALHSPVTWANNVLDAVG